MPWRADDPSGQVCPTALRTIDEGMRLPMASECTDPDAALRLSHAAAVEKDQRVDAEAFFNGIVLTRGNGTLLVCRSG